MVPISQIFVDVAASRLAEAAGVEVKEASAFLEAAGPLIRPAAVFAEISPTDILGPRVKANDWGERIVIGLLTLGPDAPRAAGEAPGGRDLARTLYSLALNDALDFIEYRLLRFLEPKGLRPGVRMIPGCPDLPLGVNRAIMDHFGPDNSLGLVLSPSGEIEGPAGTAFVYPQSEKAAARQGCAGCSHKDCPVRTAAVSGKQS